MIAYKVFVWFFFLSRICFGYLLEEDDKPASKSEDVHKPAINLREKKRTESLKEKLDQQKEKRQISTKLALVPLLPS